MDSTPRPVSILRLSLARRYGRHKEVKKKKEKKDSPRAKCEAPSTRRRNKGPHTTMLYLSKVVCIGPRSKAFTTAILPKLGEALAISKLHSKKSTGKAFAMPTGIPWSRCRCRRLVRFVPAGSTFSARACAADGATASEYACLPCSL